MNHREDLLFLLGVLGLVFYVLAPVVFPHAQNLRQPELLPVYSLMIGLGKLVRDWKKHNNHNDNPRDKEDN